MAARAPAVRSTCRSRWVGATVANIGASALSVGVCQQRPNIVAAGIVIAVLGVIACGDTVPEVWRIADGFGDAVAELRARC